MANDAPARSPVQLCKLSGATEQMPDHGADKQDQEDKEQDLGDSSGGDSHTGKTEKRRDQSENKESKCITQHGNLLPRDEVLRLALMAGDKIVKFMPP
jgi:hypothetical protein